MYVAAPSSRAPGSPPGSEEVATPEKQARNGAPRFRPVRHAGGESRKPHRLHGARLFPTARDTVKRDGRTTSVESGALSWGGTDSYEERFP